jgi:glutamate racemase
MSSIKSEPKESRISHGKLGFFDSWVGGLSVMAEFKALYPELDMVYFGDRANCPYGDRAPEEILTLTLAGVARLVEAGCVIIIIACNTAAAHAIVYLQNVVYPHGCGVKILGVTIPGVEAALEFAEFVGKNSRLSPIPLHTIGVLATQVTVNARVYSRKMQEHISDAQVIEIAVPWLVDLIESGATIWTAGQITLALDPSMITEIQTLLHQQLSLFAPELTGLTLPITLVLGCTHYPLVQEHIEQVWREIYGVPVELINPGRAAAEEFNSYLMRHAEFSLSKKATIRLI